MLGRLERPLRTIGPMEHDGESESSFGSLSVAEFLGAVASKTPAPGGGAVASMTGALASALGQMVVAYSVGKKSLAEYEPRLRGAILRLERARALLLGLADEDAEAYNLVNTLQKLPEDDERRKATLDDALHASVQVPLATMAACVDLLRLFLELAPITNKHLRSDLGISAVLADAAARASRWNVVVNAAQLSREQDRLHTSRQLNAMLHDSAALVRQVEQACEV